MLFAAGVAAVGCSHRSPLLEPTPEELQTPAPDSFRVSFQTTRGNVLVMAHRDWSPYGVDRFYFLVTNGYYDDTYFFRTVKGFVSQWGVSGNPLINQAWRRKSIPDDPVLRSNQPGMIAFARGGPHSRTVELFVSYRNNARLDTLNGFGFPPIAQVVDGMGVVDSLYNGYGEGPPRGKGPSQDSIERVGNDYLKRKFPLLDRIITARVTRSWGDTLRASMSLQRDGFGQGRSGGRGRGG
ncbi:MAG TPA: peptidylprolyl isomerase, partial [Gemmatimonadaceae bacterium]